MPPANAERPDNTRRSDLRVDEHEPVARVPQPRRTSEPSVDSLSDRSGIGEARRREAEQRNATAAELFQAGEYIEAVKMFEAALNSCRVVLGDHHPDTLRVAGNLGVALVAAGESRPEVRRGIRLIETTMVARTEALGGDHPDTLTALNALAVAHRRAGQPDKALDVAKRAVLARTRALGPTHVDTLTSRMGLALALAATGDTTHAHRIASSTLSAAEDALGEEHEHIYALVACGEDANLLRREL
jgi:tetratricopeptide (TPR) repeat protein